MVSGTSPATGAGLLTGAVSVKDTARSGQLENSTSSYPTPGAVWGKAKSTTVFHRSLGLFCSGDTHTCGVYIDTYSCGCPQRLGEADRSCSVSRFSTFGLKMLYRLQRIVI